MSLVILVDFGASRIKSALFNIDTSKLICEAQVVSPSVKSHAIDRRKYEIPIEEYWVALEKNFLSLCSNIRSDQEIKGIWICSEMHGFVLADSSGHALTPYISWKDERAAHDEISGVPTLERLKSDLPDFQNITGMQLKSGLPIVTLSSILRLNGGCLGWATSDSNVFILTLVDWLLLRGGATEPRSDITLLMGLGFHDWRSGKPSEEILKKVIGDSFVPNFLEIKRNRTDTLGLISICGRSIPVYAGFGDFQAALLGAGYVNDGHAIINLGTGSQVAVPYAHSGRKDTELRVTADDSIAEVITHIPCGRALNVLACFFDQFSINSTESIFWDAWNHITISEIISSRLDSNLCFFESAWGKQSCKASGWIGVSEGATDLRSVMAGIAKSWIKQYCAALTLLDPDCSIKTVIVSGGVAHKSNFLLSAFRHFDKERQYVLVESTTGEETLDGLLSFVKLT